MTQVVVVEQPTEVIVTGPETATVVTVGIQGPPGSSGIQDAVFTQASPATTWAITHALNRKPSVTVIDQSGNTIIGFGVNYPDNSHINLTFASAVAGTAYLV